ncbi:MAG TPA: heme-binding domain-containing protein [Terriglobales bacterium]|nr:heme-binding domain-containing protein [Terriglobales bacterium]
MNLAAKVSSAGGVILVLGIALSFVHPFGNARVVDQNKTMVLPGPEIPPEVRQIVVSKCADCHSNATRWPVYSRFAPASWLVERDIMEAREHMNFSLWQEYDKDMQIDLLARGATEVRKGDMPPKQYTLMHPEARFTDAERTLLINWMKTERTRLRAQATTK